MTEDDPRTGMTCNSNFQGEAVEMNLHRASSFAKKSLSSLEVIAHASAQPPATGAQAAKRTTPFACNNAISSSGRASSSASTDKVSSPSLGGKPGARCVSPTNLIGLP